MPVTVYRSDDVGAPTLTSADGGLITLLDAVLVNGYGAKAAAGWSKPFSGTNQAIYRNSVANGGMGCFFQIDDSLATTGYTASFAHMTKVTGASNMTGFGAHTEPFAGGSYSSLPKNSANAPAEVKSWVIVADEHTVIYMLRQDTGANGVTISGTDFYTPYYFGDYSGWVPGQIGTSLLSGIHYNGTAYRSSLVYDPHQHVHKHQDGSYPRAAGILKGYIGDRSSFTYASSDRITPRRGKLIIQGLRVLSATLSDYDGTFRGYFHVRTNDSVGLNTADTFVENGKTFMLFRIIDAADDVFAAVEISNTWDPV